MRRMPGGGSGPMGPMDLQKMMKHAQKMQEDLVKAQQELAGLTVEGTAGGGTVTVTANGHREVTGIRIKPEAIDPEDPETLEDLLLAAVRDAQSRAAQLAERQLGGITGNLQLPGLM